MKKMIIISITFFVTITSRNHIFYDGIFLSNYCFGSYENVISALV